jgi:hypothetical protein
MAPKLLSADELRELLEETMGRHNMTVEEFLKADEIAFESEELNRLSFMVRVSMHADLDVAAFLQRAFLGPDRSFEQQLAEIQKLKSKKSKKRRNKNGK